ncbi:MAG: lysine 2,3-aminomutase [Cyclobacteriaceae bacterium]
MTTPINKYKVYTIRNFREISQVKSFLSPGECKDIEVVGNVFPFKVDNYVIDQLINWKNVPDDPIFRLTFPQKEMLSKEHFTEMSNALEENMTGVQLKAVANKIRYQLNPNPAGQATNVPTVGGEKLPGMQHKYKETVLFFPANSQTCHSYCTFCFRWPQFVGLDELKFAMKEAELLKQYVQENTEVTDILFTGGDPMVMSASKFESYIEPLLNTDIPNLRNIRIGTKSLAYWPYKFTSDKDADDMLRLFERIVKKGYHLAFMAHFNHPNELRTEAVQEAIRRILETGAVIRTQAPLMKHINCDAETWKDMWRLQVELGCVPYYMFLARDTGAQDYFAVKLEEALEVYRKVYNSVSGIVRTGRGPVMSCNPGKIQVLDITEIQGEKVFVLRFIQARKKEWVGKTFFAAYNPDAIWIDDLKPAFNQEYFFYESEYERTLAI